MAKGGRRVGAGRKPTPTALRVLTGGRPRRGGKKAADTEPQFAPHSLEPPARLEEAERAVWQDLAPKLAELGVLTVVDELALVQLCRIQVECDELHEILVSEGRTYRFDTGQSIEIRKHPAQSLWENACRRLDAAYAGFGLTPSSRTRVRIDPKKPADPVEEWRRKHGLS